jgi:two-component system response regulator HydG
MKPKVLIADDDAGVRYTLRDILETAGLEVDEAADGEAALERLGAGRFDLVITDLRMPRMDGLALLGRMQALPPPLPKVVMITAHGSERHAVEAMKSGAFDYFKKPFDNDELMAVVQRAVGVLRLEAERDQLAGELNLSRSLLFESPAMRRVAGMVQRVAPHDVTVLVTGESGTGKERVAEAIVRASKRASRPFIRFNCAAITAELAESELFGHAKGAFTGAVRARPGLFREADGGTLLLDEVGELDPQTQTRLLRVLQEGEVRPVGEERPVPVDVRIIAATHRDLGRRVAEGHFREDLFYRLKVVTLEVPPLRERPEDILVLARHFVARAAERFGKGPLRLGSDDEARLLAHPWRGNVRELENAIECAVVLAHDDRLEIPLRSEATQEPLASLKERVEAYERGLIVAALQATQGNRSETARQLGIGRATLHEKLRKYGIGPGDES